MIMSTTKMPKVYYWRVNADGNINGRVYDHPTIKNGDPILLTSIVWLGETKDWLMVTVGIRGVSETTYLCDLNSEQIKEPSLRAELDGFRANLHKYGRMKK